MKLDEPELTGVFPFRKRVVGLLSQPRGFYYLLTTSLLPRYHFFTTLLLLHYHFIIIILSFYGGV